MLYSELPPAKQEIFKYYGSMAGITPEEAFNYYVDYLETKKKTGNELIDESNLALKKYDDSIDSNLIKAKAKAMIDNKLVTATQFLNDEKARIIDEMLENVLTNLSEFEENLVKISTNSSASPLCIKRQGRIYWVEFPDERYDELEPELWRSGGGLFHPHCRHNMSVYFDGISSLPPQPQPSEADLKKAYDDSQFKNYVDRNKKKWYDLKENARNTGNPNYDHYKNKWKEWSERANNL